MKSDSQIQTDVIQELKWDPSVTHTHIGVSVFDSIVTLSGIVPSYIEKFSAVNAAQRVSGVKAVVENIEIKIPSSIKITDQDIAESILQQFKWNVQIPDKSIKVNVDNGWVEIYGEVEWQFQKDAAKKAVMALTGVRGVSNNIVIRQKVIKPEIIKQRISEALQRKAEVDAKGINISVLGSRVTLSGKVSSFAEKENAKWAAWSSPGVTSVQNDLSVFNLATA